MASVTTPKISPLAISMLREALNEVAIEKAEVAAKPLLRADRLDKKELLGAGDIDLAAMEHLKSSSGELAHHSAHDKVELAVKSTSTDEKIKITPVSYVMKAASLPDVGMTLDQNGIMQSRVAQYHVYNNLRLKFIEPIGKSSEWLHMDQSEWLVRVGDDENAVAGGSDQYDEKSYPGTFAKEDIKKGTEIGFLEFEASNEAVSYQSKEIKAAIEAKRTVSVRAICKELDDYLSEAMSARNIEFVATPEPAPIKDTDSVAPVTGDDIDGTMWWQFRYRTTRDIAKGEPIYRCGGAAWHLFNNLDKTPRWWHLANSELMGKIASRYLNNCPREQLSLARVYDDMLIKNEKQRKAVEEKKQAIQKVAREREDCLAGNCVMKKAGQPCPHKAAKVKLNEKYGSSDQQSSTNNMSGSRMDHSKLAYFKKAVSARKKLEALRVAKRTGSKANFQASDESDGNVLEKSQENGMYPSDLKAIDEYVPKDLVLS
jgi:hypothetical protein